MGSGLDDSYAGLLESLSNVGDLLDRFRAEPLSPKRDAAIERLSEVMASATSAVRSGSIGQGRAGRP